MLALSDLNREFERLWNNQKDIKRHQFRGRMKSKLEARGIPFTKENARKLWNGSLIQEERERRRTQPPVRKYEPRRRKPFKRRGRRR